MKGFLLGRFLALAACLLLGSVLVPGCKARLGPANERDDIREENLELRDQVAELEEKLALRTAQIASMQQAQEVAGGFDIQGAEPIVLSKLTLGDYSGLLDEDGDGQVDSLRAYVRPLSQRGRFMLVSGQAVLQLVGLPAESGQAPVMITEVIYEPDDWSEAYRTGFTGTHYTLKAKLDSVLLEEMSGVVIRVKLTESPTGVVVEAQAARNVNG